MVGFSGLAGDLNNVIGGANYSSSATTPAAVRVTYGYVGVG